jgi:hypothetical protein
VRADNGDSVAGAPLATDGEGDDGGAIACEVVLAAGPECRCPGVAFADKLEAGLFKALGRGLDGVEG